MYILVLFAVITAFMALRIINTRKKAGIRGWVKSQDLDGKGSRVYRDHRTGISAKPDVVERRRVIEYKSAHVLDKARRSDVLQVAAEMIATGRSEGELRYGNNKKFRLQKNKPEVRLAMKEVLRITELMKWHLLKGKAPKAKPFRRKCVTCVFQQECSDAML